MHLRFLFPFFIIDLELKDSDSDAISIFKKYPGLELIDKVQQNNKDTITAVFTGHLTDTAENLAKLYYDFLLNKADPNDMKKIFKKMIEYANQKFNFSTNINIDDLSSECKGVSFKLGTEAQWEICLRYLFRNNRDIEKAEYMCIGQGFSGASVLSVYLGKQLPRVLKLHLYKDLLKEVQNYKKYIGPYIHRKTSTSKAFLAQAGELGILSYSLLGKEGNIKTLSSLIREKDKSINSYIKDHFKYNCENWFLEKKTSPKQFAFQFKTHFKADMNKLIATKSIKELLTSGIFTYATKNVMKLLISRKGVDSKNKKEVIDLINEATSSCYNKILSRPLTFCHGDLNINNLILQDDHLYLIDFANAKEEMPRMIDFVKLETSIKYDIIDKFEKIDSNEQFKLAADFEDALLNNLFSKDLADNVPKMFKTKAEAIAAIRECAEDECGNEAEIEYSMGLFFITVKYIEYLIEQCNQGIDKHVSLVQIIYSAYRLAKKIEIKRENTV